VARNRKRAKERRARRPQPVATARTEREDAAPDPISHATPDVELAEAQLAVGRPELEAEELAGDHAEDFEQELGPEEVEEDGLEAAQEATEAAPVPARHAPSGNRLINFVQGSWRELQRVQWPDRRQVVQATGVVIGFVIVAGVYLGVADWAAGKIVTFIIK